ncbi:helix-turn-helix transcriptional regulator [Pelomonas sp. KK5]|uniref:helix-turn-helix transcriptional regulator n=1 Tax=Pelomonas sp. KK5 TaxID=1855730 RepID=UPI00097C4800|nr:helix-turn-helix transcriptional regulator [Pelomonas sp. KK5]
MSTCVSLAGIDAALEPPLAASSLRQAFDGVRRDPGSVQLAEAGCEGDAYLLSAREPGRHVAMEYVRLDRGVWLVFGELQYDEPIVQWHRQRRELTFVMVLRGACMLSTAAHPEQRSICSEGHVIGTASMGDTMVCRHIPPGVRCQAVSLVFDDEAALRDFGLDPMAVQCWLGPETGAPRSARSPFRVTIGTPNGHVLKAAQSILWTRFTGTHRRLYLKSKAGELMCHLLATPAGAVDSAGFPAIGPQSDDAVAAIAHAALSDPDDCPEIPDLAVRLQVSVSRLLAVFRARYGRSPHEHLSATRMVRARRLIQQTNKPLIDVALACGYEHHSSFSTAYRRTYGETPIATRRAVARPA